MKFVMPGDKLGYAEEYAAGKGVYEENGELFASVAGRVVMKNRVISVEPVKRIPEINKGDVVVGRIIDLRNSLALVEIARKEGSDRGLMHTGLGAIHISNVQPGYLKDISTAFGYRDIVRARVVDVEQMRLSTKEEGMGVIKAICSVCKEGLVLEKDKLVCPSCGNVEKRRISPEYGKGRW